MEALKKCVSKHVSIDAERLEQVASTFEEVEIKKGDHFLEAGRICRKMAFIESGFLRMYNIVDGKEITIWIGSSYT